MILPTKHIPVEQSLLGIGADMIRRLDRPRTVTSLWEEMRDLPTLGSFDRFSLALVLLYALGAVEIRSGQLRRSTR
jgi:hypothetical protein